ncbi:MAG TPA: glycerate kinase [Clostridia bacterium]|nr:MAG: Glycerate kinase [Firmicutes bacterium ADurb.Bin248]HOG00534.1 glycerate kinase [Clostridia bacterium]HOS18676.1 glycerate kinase [Clostridia bacterium]HPK17143.1 glycerate kinase [Clostridia bacterium]
MPRSFSRFLLAPDSFKGTMTAQEVCDIWENAIRRRLPDARVRRLPMSDGGEGLTAFFLRQKNGSAQFVDVPDPFGTPVRACYAMLPDHTAAIEAAACVGLPLVEGRKNPLRATTRGLGMMLLDAASRGAKRIVLGLGGSCTNDCGIGMAESLGFRFYDADHGPLEALPSNMRRVACVEPPVRNPLEAITVCAACDVDNPLLGENGATYTFAPQKGADARMLPELERGMQNMARVIERDLKKRVSQTPGAGAAGGLGAAVPAFLGGSLTSGIDLLLDEADFDRLLEETDVVWTGEGCIDAQSARGKVPVGIARRCKKRNIPCIALCGSAAQDISSVYGEGITAVLTALARPGDMSLVKETCRDDMDALADALMRLMLC